MVLVAGVGYRNLVLSFLHHGAAVDHLSTFNGKIVACHGHKERLRVSINGFFHGIEVLRRSQVWRLKMIRLQTVSYPVTTLPPLSVRGAEYIGHVGFTQYDQVDPVLC